MVKKIVSQGRIYPQAVPGRKYYYSLKARVEDGVLVGTPEQEQGFIVDGVLEKQDKREEIGLEGRNVCG